MVTILTVVISCAVLAALLCAMLRIHWFVFAADSPRYLVYCERAKAFGVTTLDEYYRAGWMTFGTTEVMLPAWELVFTNEEGPLFLAHRSGTPQDFNALMEHSKLVRVMNMFVPCREVPPIASKVYQKAAASVDIPDWHGQSLSGEQRLDRIYRHLYGFGKDSLRAKIYLFACERDDLIVPFMMLAFMMVLFFVVYVATWNGTLYHLLSLGTKLL